MQLHSWALVLCKTSIFLPNNTFWGGKGEKNTLKGDAPHPCCAAELLQGEGG